MSTLSTIFNGIRLPNGQPQPVGIFQVSGPEQFVLTAIPSLGQKAYSHPLYLLNSTAGGLHRRSPDRLIQTRKVETIQKKVVRGVGVM